MVVQGDTRDIRRVWTEYGKKRSEKLRNLLMEHYLPVVRHIAQRIHTKLPREVELDDLVSAGTFGLMYAIAAYDPHRKVKFETYCSSRIRGAILDELRAMDWVPRLARVRSQKLAVATHHLQMELGRNPSHEEIATRLKVSAAELKKITRDGSVVRVLPLGRPQNDNDEDQHSSDVFEDPAESRRSGWVDRADLRELVKSELSRAEQLIVVLYYFEQMTMKEIGATLDLSESRVSQMHSSILMRLKKQLSDRREELVELAA